MHRFMILLLACAGQAQATTWDEPWHRDVVRAATTFGRYEIVGSTPDKVTLKLVKHVAGEESGAQVDVTAFYALRLTSQSAGHGPSFDLPAGEQAYFYLQHKGGKWTLATPTAGYARVRPPEQVAATYRISQQQALVDAPLYEDTQRCIFQVLHAQPCDARVGAFIAAELAKPVEIMDDDSTDASLAGFFRQHVALETASFTRYPVSSATLERFLVTPNMHVQLSAVRVLAASPRADKAQRLMAFVEDDKANMTARAMAAMLLQEIGAHEMKQRLLDYAPKASEEPVGLGVNIMDPRIGTRFPDSLRHAVARSGALL